MAMLSGRFAGAVVRTRVTESLASALVDRTASSTLASATPNREGRLIKLAPPALPNIPRLAGGKRAGSRSVGRGPADLIRASHRLRRISCIREPGYDHLWPNGWIPGL